MSDQESYSAWRGPVEDAEFRERLMTTRDKLTTTVTQLNAYVAELDAALRAILESDRQEDKDAPPPAKGGLRSEELDAILKPDRSGGKE